MFKFSIRIGLVALVTMAVIYGCGENGDSPTAPVNTARPAALTVQLECGEVTFLSALSPVLPVWKDSVEAAIADSLLDDTPAFTEESTVDGYLNALVPVLQQWQSAINGELESDILDAVPDFDASSHHQDYLDGLSMLLVDWKSALENAREMTFLPATPVFQRDDVAPGIVCVADTTVGCADSIGVAVEFDVAAMDDCDPAPVVTCEPASGSVFPLGTTEVSCTAVDSSGNMSTCTFNVTVEAATPPEITCPADTTVECAGAEGTVVEFVVSASSECSDTVIVVCEPASGSAFPVGTTTVTCVATDGFGNSSECTFSVMVEDTEPPMITCPSDTTLQCTGDGGAVLEFVVEATDACDDSVIVVCEPPSGSTFALGTTTVSCTATDGSGNTATCTFAVTVEDTIPPTINSVTASPRMLWPPNHKWVDVHITVDAADTCDSTPSCTILDVTSNEPINGIGDGNTEPDWMITGDNSLKLRAERAGPLSGRVYHVLIRCEDDSGNGVESSVDVVVPHDRSGK